MLYCGGLELNLQYLPRMPVCVFVYMYMSEFLHGSSLLKEFSDQHGREVHDSHPYIVCK